MSANDLTTLADVKIWLGRTDANSDTLLAGLITRASRQIYSYLQRPELLPHAVTEVRDGTSGSFLTLRQWPVLSVSSVIVNDVPIPQADGANAGWSVDAWDGVPPGRPQGIYLRGYAFGLSLPGLRDIRNVKIAYRAGHQLTAEPQIVSGGTVTASAPYGAWVTDTGVAYANGTPLARVAAAPAAGQYALGLTSGSYFFNTADEGASLLINYGFVPHDLADACIELVSERYKYSQRIGEKTHSLGGNETVAFDITRLTPIVTSLLQPYRDLLAL